MSEWIDVKHAMPQEDDWVLVWDGNYVGCAFSLEDGWSMADDMLMPDHGAITHWMPLPAPPETGGNK